MTPEMFFCSCCKYAIAKSYNPPTGGSIVARSWTPCPHIRLPTERQNFKLGWLLQCRRFILWFKCVPNCRIRYVYCEHLYTLQTHTEDPESWATHNYSTQFTSLCVSFKYGHRMQGKSKYSNYHIWYIATWVLLR